MAKRNITNLNRATVLKAGSNATRSKGMTGRRGLTNNETGKLGANGKILSRRQVYGQVRAGMGLSAG